MLFARNIDLLWSEANSEPVTHLKWCFFTKIVYCLRSLTILTRSSIFRSVTWCWICLVHFFRFTFIIDLFSSPNIFKYSWMLFLHVNVCLTIEIPQQCLSYYLDVLVNFGQIFALFLGTFIVDFEYYLFIVNDTLWQNFVEN